MDTYDEPKGRVHRECMRAHFVSRVKERLGFRLTPHEIDGFEYLIDRGEVKEVPWPQTDPNRVAYDLHVRGHRVVAVYDREAHCLCTLLSSGPSGHGADFNPLAQALLAAGLMKKVR